MAERKRVVALVTGASSGLGNAVATQLAKKGYAVYGASRSAETRQRKADEFFEPVTMDASSDGSVSAAVAYVLAKEGRIDALVCCAGMGIAGAVEETPVAEAIRQMDVNFIGVVRIVQSVLPGMRKAGGTILVIGSMAGLTGIPFQSFYSASKYALEGFVESLRMELCQFPVRVALIEPGDFRTGFTSARRILGLGADSPYAVQGRRAIKVMEDSERAGSDPVIVARLVLSLLARKKLRSRYTVGPGVQKFAMVLKRFLPHRLYELLIMANYQLNSGNEE